MKEQHNFEKLVSGYRVPSSKIKDEVWSALQSKLKTTPQKQVTPWNKQRIFAVAASLSFFVILFTFLADSFLTTKKYYAEGGRQIEILLPDHSQVTLNPNSKLRVNYSFISGTRNLKLNGEGLFEVQSGKKFTVNFKGGKVEVLGTVFSVSAYKNSTSIVNCIDGSVNVVTNTGETQLKPGTGIILKSGKTEFMANVKIDEVINELNGIYQWKNESLYTIFERLENRFGYKINATETIKLRKFSGDVNVSEIGDACEILAFAMDLKYSIDYKTKTINFEESD